MFDDNAINRRTVREMTTNWKVQPKAPEPQSPEPALVDFAQLRDVTDDDPDRIRRFIDLYLAQAGPLLNDLKAAIQTGAGAEVARLAHKLASSSGSCGVAALDLPLRELEKLGLAGELAGAGIFLERVRDKFPLVQDGMNHFAETLSSPISS